MARIRSFHDVTKDRQRRHEAVECGVSTFTDSQGTKYLQLDTYGRSSRKLVGDASQSIQLDREAAIRLKAYIEATFNL